MEEIKEQYITPNPILYRYRGYPEMSLISHDFDNVKNIVKTEKQNEVTTLTFDIPFTVDRKINVDSCEKLVKFENEYYIIKKIETENSTSANMKVTCESESTELKGVYCTYMDLIGVSPKEMFDKIMSSTMHPMNVNYKWKGTDVPINKKRHLQTDNECSVYQNLISMAEVFNGWLEFSTDENEQNWVYLRTQAIDNDKFIKKDLDMKSLNITYSTEEIFTRLEPFGYTDSDDVELNIMKVNPTGKSYIENYSWYIGMGIPDNIILKEAKYQQLKVIRETDYTDANDLLELAKEELEKCCKPQLDATLEMSDLSIYIDSLDEPPKVGYKLRCIDEDINFIFDCTITGVERDYENPMSTRVEISNVIRYDTIMQDINHAIDSNNSITGSDGNGTYVPAEKVCVCEGGDHVNVTKKFGNQQTLITQNYNEIKLTTENLGKSIGEVSVKADNIALTVTDFKTDAYGKIETMAGQISTKVSSGDGFTSEMKQNSKAFKYLFSDVTGDSVTIDSNGIIAENPNGSYTRLGSKGLEHLDSISDRNGKPYHYLSWSDYVDFECDDAYDYTPIPVPLPSMFNDIDEDNMSVKVSIQKLYKEGEFMPYWFGGYGKIKNGKVYLYGLSAWRRYYYDTNDTDRWIEKFGSPVNGSIILSFTVTA